MRRPLLASVLIAALLLAGCAGLQSDQPPEITLREALITVRQEFVRTHELYRAARTAGALTAVEWEEWAAFGQRFQVTYDRAYRAWLAGADTPSTRAEIRTLSDQLFFYALARTRR